jgi:opacity protein-like surface antigen
MLDFTGSQDCVDSPMVPGTCANSQNRLTYRLGGGAEYSIASTVPLRAGYMYDSDLSAHHVSGGIGYFNTSHGFGFDFSFRQRVSGGNETVLLLGLRVLKQQ